MSEPTETPTKSEVLCSAALSSLPRRIIVNAKGSFHGGGYRIGIDREKRGTTLFILILVHARKQERPLYNGIQKLDIHRTVVIDPPFNRVVVLNPAREPIATFTF